MSSAREIICPCCKKKVVFKKNSAGKWVGTIGGGGAGYFLASGLGIAGAILGAPIAIPAALVGLGIGTILGNRVGAALDNATVKCPSCGKSMSV